ncbi:MAG: hypothetical protein Q9169_004595 [Polycauliona sp. 2 TL-2023]
MKTLLPALVICAGSVVSAKPSRFSSSRLDVQVTIEDDHKDPAVGNLASLPDQFTLDASTSEEYNTPVGFNKVKIFGQMETDITSIFTLQANKLRVSSRPHLTVGERPHVYEGDNDRVVSLVPAFYESFDFEAVEESDGMYIQLTKDCKSLAPYHGDSWPVPKSCE